MKVTLFVVAIVNVATESLYERRDTVTALDYKKKKEVWSGVWAKFSVLTLTRTALYTELYVVVSFRFYIGWLHLIYIVWLVCSQIWREIHFFADVSWKYFIGLQFLMTLSFFLDTFTSGNTFSLSAFWKLKINRYLSRFHELLLWSCQDTGPARWKTGVHQRYHRYSSREGQEEDSSTCHRDLEMYVNSLLTPWPTMRT